MPVYVLDIKQELDLYILFQSFKTALWGVVIFILFLQMKKLVLWV